MSVTKSEIRACLYYEFKRGCTAAETTRRINEVFGEDSCSYECAKKWFQQFKNGRINLEDEPRSGRPLADIDDDILKAIQNNPRATLEELSLDISCSLPTIWNHLKRLGFTKKMDQIVPHDLSDFQRKQRVAICSSLIVRNQNESVLERLITVDEKWVLYNNSRRSSSWVKPCQNCGQSPKPNVHPKVLLSVWWSASGIIYWECLEPGQTINANVYCQQIDRVHAALLTKQPSLINRKGVIVL